MRRFALLEPIAFLVVVVNCGNLFAQPPDILRDYRFIPSHTMVHVSGGSQNYDMDLTIAGKFGLVTGYDYEVSPTANIPTLVPHAEFVDVHGILYNPRSLAPLPVPGWDLDKTLNLSGLVGTFSDPSLLHFHGVDGQGIPITFDAMLRGPLLHLTGMNYLPPTCATCTQYIGYKVDALAFMKPYADFNLDGTIDGGDFGIWRAAVGIAGSTSFEQGDANGDGVVDSADYVLWRKMLGPATSLSVFADGGSLGNTSVPEPEAVLLTILGLVLLLVVRTRLIETRTV